MLPATSPIAKLKKTKSPGQDVVVNPKTSVTCSNVPEALFDPPAAKKHFSKFGQVQRIRLLPKRQVCVIEYDQPSSAERAVLNAGAYDGFMFDVTRSKPRMRRHSKKDDDPEWVPDPGVKEELSAMGEAPSYMVTRQNVMQVDPESPLTKGKMLSRVVNQSSLKKKILQKVKKTPVMQQPSGTESPVVITTTQTSLSTSEAAVELFQLRSRTSLTPDEQWRILDARDRILRGWGGAGSRVKVGGATIGTCQDMCPEKELLHRQAEHQVMTLETVVESDGTLDPARAVKQYSRSSADQEIPMCYELRPPRALLRTCAYLLHRLADTDRPVSLADWFHFMWDRLRSIRKDIAQQALCCSDSISLVEMCARFHAHCAARLADLEHTQFDQKLNTDNLTKCLQTLKHMYTDVGPEQKPMEAEFRGYIALLNLGDANFWWEIKQLPTEIQKSAPIALAIKIFNALDNNNYVRFFRLVRDEATYLQACILLRYFNDVRARALARIVKAYAPRGGSRYPAEDAMSSLAFESIESLKSFINHYGLRFARTDDMELAIILNRNQFIEDSDPYPIARAIHLIESKRKGTVGEIIAGGTLPEYIEQDLFTSFTQDGKLKESALTAADQGYNTMNDSNKDIKSLKAEIQRLCQGGKIHASVEKPPVAKAIEPKTNLFVKPISKSTFSAPTVVSDTTDSFSFKPAIVVASTDIINNSPEKAFAADIKSSFSFSPPQPTQGSILFRADSGKRLFGAKITTDENDFVKSNDFKNKNTPSVFGGVKSDASVFKKPEVVKSVFSQPTEAKPPNVFRITQNKNVFATKTESTKSQMSGKNIFSAKSESLFSNSDDKTAKGSNIFGNFASKSEGESVKQTPNIFGNFGKASTSSNVFSNVDNAEKPTTAQSIFSSSESSANLSPSSLFKSAINPPNGSDAKGYSVFQSKNKAQTVANNILNSVNAQSGSVYDFNQNDEDAQKQQEEFQRLQDERIKEEQRLLQEQMKREERRQEILKEEESRRQEEARKKQEEMKRLEEKRRKEEQRKQEELKKKLEEERKAELKRKAEEEKRFQAKVEKESAELIEELVDDVGDETVQHMLKEELDKFNSLMSFAGIVTEDVLTELCNEMCQSEMRAEKFWTEKLMKKWFYVWRSHYIRNVKRRDLLKDTPLWLTQNTPFEEANCLRRFVENSTLKNMNAIHRGYRFVGELKQIPTPDPYNLMEIIRSPLLKRMNQINYPYDKCFFWKLALVSPGSMKWLHKKINLEKWLLDVFGDKKKHDVSKTLIHVGKQSWNHLMDFAISVSLASYDKMYDHGEAVEGANGVLFYMTEKDNNFTNTIEQTLKHKYPYQVIPVAIVIPKMENVDEKNRMENVLSNLVRQNVISAFRIYVVESQNISESLNICTKSAMKWLAKHFPQVPPIEIDYLKSICQRYLGNEIWCMLRNERDSRMDTVLRDLYKLIKCYNNAVDRLTDVITNEDLFNHSSFPLEFLKYLDSASPYPKPYEFVPSSVKNSENITAIKGIMKQLKLPDPSSEFNPITAITMQQQMRTYCNKIGWFDDPEDVVCKVIAVLPNELSDMSMPREDFSKYFAHYDLIDFLNIVVYEKISRLNNFDNRFAVYEKSVLDDYRNVSWLYEISVIKEIKHKALEYDDDIDYFIKAKRRKIELDSMEYLMLEDKDRTLVDESIKDVDDTISKYNDCTEAVKQLELALEEEKIKSLEFENMLRSALADI